MQLEDPAATQSFTRIVTDLEAKLGHALAIAGRAVKDSNSVTGCYYPKPVEQHAWESDMQQL